MSTVRSANDELIPTRQSLLEKLRRWDDHTSWQEFFDTYWKLIYRAALNAGLRPVEAEEVVQETVISVAKQMPGFTYRPREEGGSFKRWLLNLTTWRIKDQFRKRKPEQPLDPTPSSGEEDRPAREWADPDANQLEQLWDAEWENNLFDAAMQKVKRKVNPKHFQIFFLYVIKHWSALRVAKSLNVSMTEVYTVKHRVAGLVKSTLAQIRERPLA